MRLRAVWTVALFAICAFGGQGTSPSQSNNIKIAGHKVLCIYDTKNTGLTLPFIRTIFEDKFGHFWISSLENITLFDENQASWKTFSSKTNDLIENRIDLIAQSNDGKTWFAASPVTNFGRSKVSNYDSKIWTSLEVGKDPLSPSANGIHSHTLYTMFQGQRGKVWFSLFDGLASFDGQNWLYHLHLSRKIGKEAPINSYFGIQDSDGYIWLSDNIQGILRLDETKSEWKIFDPVAMKLNHNALLPNGDTDDLAAARAKSIDYIYEDRNKRIWFATSDGH